MEVLKSTFICIILLLSVSKYFTKASPGVIRFCDTRGRQFTISSEQCPGGTHLNPKYLGDTVQNGHMWNCICTTGS